MKITIVGTGAMGSVYAGILAEAGHEVWAVDIWHDHVARIQAQGLRVEGASGDRVVHSVNAVHAVHEAGESDLFIIGTKVDGVQSASKAIAPLVRRQTTVLAMQNGLGSGARVAAHIPKENIMVGMAMGFGASMRGVGHVHHNGMAQIRIGEMEGGTTNRGTGIAEMWRDAGFNTKFFTDIDQLIWEKLVCNAAFSGPCTVFARTVGQMRNDPDAWRVVIQCGTEAYAVGRAAGAQFDFSDPEDHITSFSDGVLNARPSMLLDHMARQRSEVDVINGIIPEVGRKHGIAAPYNEVVSAIVRARENDFPV